MTVSGDLGLESRVLHEENQKNSLPRPKKFKLDCRWSSTPDTVQEFGLDTSGDNPGLEPHWHEIVTCCSPGKPGYPENLSSKFIRVECPSDTFTASAAVLVCSMSPRQLLSQQSRSLRRSPRRSPQPLGRIIFSNAPEKGFRFGPAGVQEVINGRCGCVLGASASVTTRLDPPRAVTVVASGPWCFRGV